MQKIKRGKSFNGLISYLLKSASHHKSAPYVIGGNVIESSAEALSAEFNTTKLLRSDVSKPVWHNSLRLPAGEHLSIQQWKMIADDYMKRMGFSETHLRAYVLHDDKDGQHIHIVASRIDATSGKLYLGKNENLISTRIIHELEKDYQLTRTKGPNAHKSAVSPSNRKKSRNEQQMEKRTGEIGSKTIIQEAIDELVSKPIQIQDFVDALATKRITAKANIASTGKMNGFSFELSGVSFKASQLGKKYSWKNLEPLIMMASNPSHGEERAPTIKEDGQIIIPIMESSFNSTMFSLPFFTKKSSPKIYVNMAMRWIETIPYLDSIVGTLRKLHIPLLRAFNAPVKLFSAYLLHLENLPEKPSPITTEKTENQFKKDVFRAKI